MNNAVLFLVLGSVVCTLVSSVIRGVSASPVHLLFGKHNKFKDIEFIYLLSDLTIGAGVSVFTLCLRKLVRLKGKTNMQSKMYIGV